MARTTVPPKQVNSVTGWLLGSENWQDYLVCSAQQWPWHAEAVQNLTTGASENFQFRNNVVSGVCLCSDWCIVCWAARRACWQTWEEGYKRFTIGWVFGGCARQPIQQLARFSTERVVFMQRAVVLGSSAAMWDQNLSVVVGAVRLIKSQRGSGGNFANTLDRLGSNIDEPVELLCQSVD